MRVRCGSGGYGKGRDAKGFSSKRESEQWWPTGCCSTPHKFNPSLERNRKKMNFFIMDSGMKHAINL